jgi:hypothetical protein
MDDSLDRWFDKRFPPLAIYHGGRDFLVLTEPLLDRLQTKDTDVEIIRVEKLDASEVSVAGPFVDRRPQPANFCGFVTQHCDFYWAAEAVEWVYESLRRKSCFPDTRPCFRR